MKRTFFLMSLLVLMIVNNLNAQENEKPKFDSNRVVKAIVFENGVNIDELKTSVILKQKVEAVDGQQVTLTYFSPNKKIEKTVYSYYAPSDSVLEVSSEQSYVFGVMSYSINNKTYAYKVGYNPIIDEGGFRSRARCWVDYYYFDNDGDGKFETMYQGSVFVHKIPDWILRNNK